MTAVQTLVPTLVPLFVALAIRRTEERIYRTLTDAGALTAESAIEFAVGRPLARSRLRRLVRKGAVGVAENGRYYLDTDGWQAYRSSRRRRGLLAMLVVLALVGITFAVASLIGWPSS